MNSGSGEKGEREEEVKAAGDTYPSAWVHLAGLLCIHIQGQL